jgi:DNA topoisomerase VI subunit B
MQFMSYDVNKAVERFEEEFASGAKENIYVDGKAESFKAFLRTELERCVSETSSDAKKMDAELDIVHRCLTDLYNHNDPEVYERIKKCLDEIQALKPPTHAEEKETV